MKLSVWLKNRPIRARLSTLMVLNSGLALTLAGVGFFTYEGLQQRDAVEHELAAEAGIIAESSTAPLSFTDTKAAAATLAALRRQNDIVEAAIYDQRKHPFALYTRPGAPARLEFPSIRAAGVYFESDSVMIFHPIEMGGEQIGTVFLKSNHDVRARLRHYLQLAVVLLSLSLGIAFVFSSRMQKTIVEPISGLSVLARTISASRDYSVRASGDHGGELGILISSFNHMLAQIQIAQESLRESEERYALAARGANDGLWDWKLTTNEIYFSPRWNEMIGYSGGDRWSDPEEWFSRIHPSDRDRVCAEVKLHREGQTAEFITEYRIRHKNGEFIWMLNRGLAVRDADGIAVRMAGSQTDITEGKIADPLTGLPNRLHLIDRIETALDENRRRGSQFAVLFLDLDRFKLINDSLGHAAGDELLVGVAARLRSGVRRVEHDNVRGASVVARLGGDEFGILLTDLREEKDASMVAERLLKELEVPFALNGRQVFARVSIGIAPGAGGGTPEDILRNADTAMYHAKARGKGRFEVFDDGMRERAVAGLEIESGLRKAIDGDELVLYYQPEISLSSTRVIGYEALVRWNHPTRGILSPSEFIPVAEESDLIVGLGRWVLREACRRLAEWQECVPLIPALSISVNVAPKQLCDPEFVDYVQRCLSETGIDPHCLRLEITESSIMSNPDLALVALRRLKMMNVGLEIDDFGTGYSSLSYLQKLPFDTVKIDRSFIRELGGGEESVEIVRTIVELARSLNMTVVAEGVETEDQLKKVKDLGCNFVQGFYFSKPIGREATLAVMRLARDRENVFAALESAVNRNRFEPVSELTAS